MKNILSATKSVCPVCLETINARRTSRDGGVFLEKTCEKHGDFSALIWEGDEESYLKWNTASKERDVPPNARAESEGCPRDCGLCAGHERLTCCVLLEVTSRCNLKCPVCFASAGEGGHLPLNEIERRLDMLMKAGGPFNLQLSGGEPTTRDDLHEIIALARQKGFEFFQLNTNGLRLAREDGYAKSLRDAGLNCVFLQFDSLRDEAYRVLRGKPLVREKLAALKSCVEAGLGVVLVPVIAPGVNEKEIGDILKFALKHSPGVRGVHFQPITYFGRFPGAPAEHRITIPFMLREIERQTRGRLRMTDFSGGGAESSYCSFHADYVKTASGLKVKKSSGSKCCCSSAHTRSAVALQWSGAPKAQKGDAIDDFLRARHDERFAVSGMLFQDAWTLDLDRLRRCYICEADGERGLVPFCAYNLTNAAGEGLYRR